MPNLIRGICNLFDRFIARRIHFRALSVESLEQRYTPTGQVQPLVGLSLNVVNESDIPVAMVSLGQIFKVQVMVQDLRNVEAAKGVFSAFADLLYDADVIEPINTNPISIGEDYQSATTGDAYTSGIINDFGGMVTDVFSNLDSQQYLLAEVSFIAKAVGNPRLRLDPPDLSVSDILLFANEPARELSDAEVSFGSSSLSVDGTRGSVPIWPSDTSPSVIEMLVLSTKSPNQNPSPKLNEPEFISDLVWYQFALNATRAITPFSLELEVVDRQLQLWEEKAAEQIKTIFAADLRYSLFSGDQLIRFGQSFSDSVVHSENIDRQIASSVDSIKVALPSPKLIKLDPSIGFQTKSQTNMDPRPKSLSTVVNEIAFAEFDTEYFSFFDVRHSFFRSVSF